MQNFQKNPQNNSNPEKNYQALNLLNHDLYAARASKPPVVKTANKIANDKHLKKINKNVQKPRKVIIPNDDESDIEMMDEDAGPSRLLAQAYQLLTPIISHANTSKQPTTDNMNVMKTSADKATGQKDVKTKRYIQPISDKISYNIAEDVLEKKANIDMKDLLIAAPALKLIKSNTTAAYAQDDPNSKRNTIMSDSDSSEISSDEDDLDPEGTTDEEQDDQLMMLEDEYNERNRCNCGCGVIILDSTKRHGTDFDMLVEAPFYLAPHSTKEYSISYSQLVDPYDDLLEGNYKVVTEYTHPSLQALENNEGRKNLRKENVLEN
ncbi:hypothetical protein INT48_003705 [Thamnidium elegans]|uniref:Uncharacterized protein n=1 Tax=Thamnidium elegans TaxID=101142 RepID=A0A8H7SG39_9FUNG|nr:hypothetical protein INT48_003705 [Thamnidium elegans]